MMKNKKLAALLGLLLAGSMTVSMAACGSTNSASDTKTDSSSQSSDSSSSDSSSDSGAGFEEVPVGPSGTAEEQDQDAGPLTVGAVYFQPIDMEPSSMGLKLLTLPSTSRPTSMPTRRAPSSATARATSCRI